ncbi:MAG: hypothetical protein K6A65_06340, partial [Succinivibrionaceae bacterium]|nr:hypothetical protein [Succinivibrionaceae bacterium]
PATGAAAEPAREDLALSMLRDGASVREVAARTGIAEAELMLLGKVKGALPGEGAHEAGPAEPAAAPQPDSPANEPAPAPSPEQRPHVAGIKARNAYGITSLKRRR